MKFKIEEYCGGKTHSTVAVFVVAFVINATPVCAQSEIELISGATTVTLNGVNGFASYNGSVGNWDVNVSTGLATPTGGPGNIDLDSVNLSIDGTSDSLMVLWSGSGYAQGDYSVAIGGVMSAGITATYTAYYGSLLSTATPLTGSYSFGPYAGTTPFAGTGTGSAADSGPFAITEQVVISGGTSPFSEIGFDYNVTAVPEPSTIALLLTGGTALAIRPLQRQKVERLTRS